MRRGIPLTAERTTSKGDGWLSVHPRDLGTVRGTVAVLQFEAPFADNSGTEQWFRAELTHDQARELGYWLIGSAFPGSGGR